MLLIENYPQTQSGIVASVRRDLIRTVNKVYDKGEGNSDFDEVAALLLILAKDFGYTEPDPAP